MESTTSTRPTATRPEEASEEHARQLDATDPGHRDLFHIPPATGGGYADVAYFAGNSLGLQPRAARAQVMEELDDWARLAVEGHGAARRPWLTYHTLMRESAARVVGALPEETVVMNTLTANLHLLMVSFYRPEGLRDRIVIEDSAFPSDSYAVRSQARLHGLDPDEAVVRLRPRPGEQTLRTEDIESYLAAEGDRVALVLLGGVNYLTGEVLDIPAITHAGHAAGAVVGWDLAHAAGNVALRLHDWDVDFAAWCSYKYLNGGPGAIAGAFVHQRHLTDSTRPRLEGWWGVDVATRFVMAPVALMPETADAWQLSTPPVLSMAPVHSSLRIFDQVGMVDLVQRSGRLTGYLQERLDAVTQSRPVEVVTPRDSARRGAQLSVRVRGFDAAEVVRRLREEHGVIADARRPDIVRLAPTPLYSTYHDCWRATEALAAVVAPDPG